MPSGKWCAGATTASLASGSTAIARDGEALLVHGDRHCAHTGEGQRLARADEARFLDPGRIVGIERQPGQQ